MLPSTGPMSMTLIANEAQKPLSARNVNDIDLRRIARKKTLGSTISWSDFRGKYRYQFVNGNFEQGSLDTSTSPATFPGWKVFLSQTKLNGISSIEGWPTPTDSTNPSNSPGDDQTITDQPGQTDPQFSALLTTDIPNGMPAGTRSMRLISLGYSAPYAIIHGPYLVSDVNNTTPLEAGDLVRFYWKAEGGSDAFDIYAYLLNIDNGSTIELANATGSSSSATTSWTQVTKTITAAENGTYKFVFVSGTYDYSGGQWLGASLYVTNVDVTKWWDL